jgi:outer membrane protein assembly factor BamA
VNRSQQHPRDIAEKQGCRQKCTQLHTGQMSHCNEWRSFRISLLSAGRPDQPMRLLAQTVFAFVLTLLLAATSCLARGADPDTGLVVQDIQCRGNISTACSFIRGHLYLAVGGKVDEGEVEDAKLRLSALPNFKSVDIHLEKGAQKGRVIVVIDVAEASPFTLSTVLGTSLRDGAHVQTVAARFGDHNLWGTGKALDLLVVGDIALSNSAKDYATRLEYFDPQLLGSKRYFVDTGLFYSRTAVDSFFGNSFNSGGNGGVDVSFGRRFGSFSYATVGYRYLFNSEADSGYLNPTSRHKYLAFDGNLTTLTESSSRVLLLTYGRNSEDDAAFPTRGWMFHLYDDWGTADHVHFAGAEARVTWRSGSSSFWTLQTRPFNDFNAPFDDDLGTSATYSRTINPSGFFGSIQRGRWYVGPGLTVIRHNEFEFGVKAGIRLETRSLGLVNLYVIGSHINRSGGGY